MTHKLLIRRMIKVESYISELIDELKYPEDDKVKNLKVGKDDAIKLLNTACAAVEEARVWIRELFNTKYVKILFQDKEYLMKNAGPDFPTSHIICEIDEKSGIAIEWPNCYAMIINDKIMRFGKEIGLKENIIQLVE